MESPPGGLVDSEPNFDWTRGEFSVSHDGVAGYVVPLWVPAGRGAVTPQLSLSYSSKAGNGLLGVGWSLGGLSTISWCGRTIAQDGYTDGGHFDGQDALCLNGNRLVPTSPPGLPTREYRTEQETFARIIAHETQDNVPNSFTVFGKDGKILTFGASSDARVQPYLLIGSPLPEPALVRAPGTPRVTTAWALDRIEDRNGNAATVEYSRTEGDAAGLWWKQLRPSQISYAPNRSVRFSYRDDRPDKIDSFSGGTHTRTDMLLSRIEMWGGPEGEPATLLRQYRMGYESNSITGRSLLSSVTECDGGDREPESETSPTRKCKLPLPFEYSLGSYDFEEMDDHAIDPTPVSGPASVSVVDVNGDGRSDLILHNNNGQKELRVAMRFPAGDGFAPTKPSGLPPASPFQTLDVDSDGRPDALAEVFVSEPQGPGRRYQLYRPTFEPAGGSSFEAVPGKLGYWRPDASSRQPVYLTDLDGNGLPDFIGTAFGTEPWSYRLNTGASREDRFAAPVETTVRRNIAFGNFAVDTNGDGRSELISSGQLTGDPGWVSWGLRADGGVESRLVNVRGAPTLTHFGDINGDGLVDAVYPNDAPDNFGELRVQLNSGNGFGSRFTAPSPTGYSAPDAPGSLTDVGVRLVDFNGDGRDDLLVFHGGTPEPGDAQEGLQVYLWTDNAFVRAPLELEIGLPAGGSWDNTQVLDFDGDGALDLVNFGADGLRAFQRLGGVPDQLTGIGDVSTGGRIELTYTTLANRTVHTPGSCDYSLTCPVSGGSVVATHKIVSDLGAGNEPTWDEYRHTYKGARADLHGRGWLGFAEHTVTRAATGATTVTEFDVTRDPGTKSYPFAQLPKKETHTVSNVNDGTGREFRRITINGYEVRPLGGAYTVEHRTSTAVEFERRVGASNWRTLRSSSTETSYDDFGNTDVVRSATTNGRSLTQDFDYRNATAAWLIGLPTRAVSRGCRSDGVCRTRESTFDYDDRGNPTVTVTEPNRPRLKLTTTTGYGPFGVVTTVTKTDNTGKSRTETREYNNADKLHPTDMINAAGHRTLVDTHSGLGVPLRATDPNGVPTTFRYDRFGRLQETNRSDGSFEHITHRNLGDRQLTTTTVAGGGETEELIDQLGRTRDRRVKTFDGRIATTHTDYDPVSQKVSRTSRPTLPDETPQFTVTHYDNRGRVTSVTAPDGALVRYEYINRQTHTYNAKGVHSYTIDTVDGEVDSLYECAAIDMSGCVGDGPDSTNWLITYFGYGSFGERTRIAAPDKTTQRMHYDTLGRPDFERLPSRGDTRTTYNAFGEVATITDAENRITTFDYDELGRVKMKTSPDGVATNTWDRALHGIGKLDQAHSSDGVTIGHTYDESGKDATTTWTIEGTSYEFGYGYDEAGRLDCITYPSIPGAAGPDAADRLTVGHLYNPHGYLAQVNDGCQPGGQVYWAAEARNVAGQLERERLGNGVLTTRAYEPATGLLDNILTTGPGALGRLGEIGYDYDDNRNVIRRDDLVHQRFETYRYDVLNRLDGWSVHTDPEQPGMSTSYTYTAIGDLRTETVHRPNQPEQTTTYRYGQRGARAHWLTSRNDHEYWYDRTGQRTSGPNGTVQYNTSGLPTVLDWGSGPGPVRRIEFAYDPDGARVVKRDDDQTTITVGGLFDRRIPAGAGGNEIHNLHNIVVDERVVAQVNRTQAASGGMNPGNLVTYLHNDLQGSTVALTTHDGEPIGDDDPPRREMFYDPFGRRIDAQNDPLDDSGRGGPRQGYTGHEHDDEFGLINMKGRIYDPETRRFLTPDPIQAPASSQTYNRYSYVQNNPATLTDPSGLLPIDSSPDPRSAAPDLMRNFMKQSEERGKALGCSDGMQSQFDDFCGTILGQYAEDNPGKISALNGSLRATPTPGDAEPSPSSDDDNSSVTSVEIYQTTVAGDEYNVEPIVIELPDPDPMAADEILGDVERTKAQIKSELAEAFVRDLEDPTLFYKGALAMLSGLGGVGLIARAATLWRVPAHLYHFTSGAGAAGINATGVIDASSHGIRALYGSGVYLTRYTSPIIATIQGARSTAAVVRVSTADLNIIPTIFPGTFRTAGRPIVLALQELARSEGMSGTAQALGALLK